MDFRTEWSSWLLLLLMMVMTAFVIPYSFEGNTLMFILLTIGIPLALTALASIPVLIICYFVKVIPDIDYSIRLAFVIMLIHLIYQQMML